MHGIIAACFLLSIAPYFALSSLLKQACDLRIVVKIWMFNAYLSQAKKSTSSPRVFIIKEEEEEITKKKRHHPPQSKNIAAPLFLEVQA